MNINSFKSENNEKSLIKRITKNWKKSGSAVAMLLLSGALVACGDQFENNALNTQEDLTSTNETEELETATSVDEVADETEELVGQTVTITGEVEEVVGLNSFVLQDEEDLFDEDQVLVISVNNQAEPIVEGETVQVTGEVRQFVVSELERDYNLTWDLDLQRELEAEYQNKAVVVADLTRVQ
ncbi:hypothetical protein [Limnoraphis robusta]|jgi:DNA/RNA endonuclease YhcR with UshA esterase domain|nr:hypothetical protein [Limnoraphis robusta]